jgi:mRNA interferase MazF
VRRAEIWTVSGGADYAGQPRPAVIIQDDHFDTDSVTLCPFTTDPTDAPLFRLLIEPDQHNGLDAPSRIMVDKVTTVRRSRLGSQVGVLDDANVLRLNRAGCIPGHGQQHMICRPVTSRRAGRRR